MQTKSPLAVTMVLLGLVVGCAPTRRSRAPRWAPRPVAAPAAPHRSPAHAPQAGALGLRRLVPALGRGRCEPVDIGGGRTVTPLCKSLPAVQVRRFIKGAALRGRPLPPSVDLRVQRRVGPVRDQGQVGLCWAFALSSVLDNGAIAHDPSADIAPLHVAASRSWNAVVSSAKPPRLTVEEQWRYTEPKGCAFDENDQNCGAKFGVHPGSGFRDPQLQAEHRRADAAHRYTFRVRENLEVAPANPEQLMAAVADGEAIYTVMGFSRQGWSWSAAKDGVLDHYPKADQGHAVAIVGYRTVGAQRQFLLQNSWGTDWGHGGFVWMDASQVVLHLQRAIVLDVIPTRPAPAPRTPEPQPLPGGCPTGQVGDLVTGACSTPCGGLFPPVNGICPLAAPTGSGACAAGQVRDLATGACSVACASGLPPAMGACLL